MTTTAKLNQKGKLKKKKKKEKKSENIKKCTWTLKYGAWSLLLLPKTSCWTLNKPFTHPMSLLGSMQKDTLDTLISSPPSFWAVKWIKREYFFIKQSLFVLVAKGITNTG